MARELSFPIKMKKSNHIYTKKEFKSHFNLKKNKNVVFTMPILRMENVSQQNLQSSYNSETKPVFKENVENHIYKVQTDYRFKERKIDTKVFTKPIARDEKEYIKNGYKRYVERLQYIKYICNLKNLSSGSGSGSSSFFSSASGSYLELEIGFIICGYGLELI